MATSSGQWDRKAAEQNLVHESARRKWKSGSPSRTIVSTAVLVNQAAEQSRSGRIEDDHRRNKSGRA